MERFVLAVLLASFGAPRKQTSTFEGTRYIFVNYRVNWRHARLACEGTGRGSLAVLEHKRAAEFVAHALARAETDAEHLWIGARRRTCGARAECFVWTDGRGTRVNETYLVRRNATFATRECLAGSRRFHERPVFVDLNCGLKRGFVCQRRKGVVWLGLK